MQGLLQFHQYTQKLQQLMSDVQSKLPRRAEGTDSQGAVTVRLGADGLPETIKVSSDWQRRRGAEAIGPAVVEAFGSAMNERMERWAQAVRESDWEARAEEFDREVPATFTGGGNSTPQGGFPERDLRHVIPRPLDELAEEMITALDSVDSPDAGSDSQAEATGTSSGHHVAITVTKGALVACEIDPQWASRQSSVRLNQVLDEALNKARTKLSEAEAAAESRSPGRQLDGLFDEALAILKDPQRYAG